MKSIIVILLGLSFLLIGTGCTAETHTSLAEIKNQGWPAHNVSIDIARISSFGGGVSYSETNRQYSFSIYDKTATFTGGMPAFEDIIVVVKEQNINFTPKEGDFIRLQGELQSSDIGDPRRGWRYDKKAMIIYATNILKTSAPANWN